VNATDYARAFYRDTAPRRRYLTNMRRGVKRNCQWLLAEIRNHREPEITVNTTPRVQPLRRPVLSLKS